MASSPWKVPEVKKDASQHALSSIMREQKRNRLTAEKVKTFAELTGCAEDLAAHFLMKARGDVAGAVEIYFDSKSNMKKLDQSPTKKESSRAIEKPSKIVAPRTQSAEPFQKKVERRIDSDGALYTKREFVEFYGGTDEWNKAETPSSQSEYDRLFALRLHNALMTGRETTFVPECRQKEKDVDEADDSLGDWHGCASATTGELKTKHDVEMNARDNSEILTHHHALHGVGDLSGEKVMLPNRVFNSLRTHFQKAKRK